MSDNQRTFLLLYNLDTMDDEFFFKKDVLLRCRGDDPNSNVTWLKNGTKVSELNSLTKTQFVEHTNGDLKILHPSKSTFSLMCLMTAFETGLPFCQLPSHSTIYWWKKEQFARKPCLGWLTSWLPSPGYCRSPFFSHYFLKSWLDRQADRIFICENTHSLSLCIYVLSMFAYVYFE